MLVYLGKIRQEFGIRALVMQMTCCSTEEGGHCDSVY